MDDLSNAPRLGEIDVPMMILAYASTAKPRRDAHEVRMEAAALALLKLRGVSRLERLEKAIVYLAINGETISFTGTEVNTRSGYFALRSDYGGFIDTVIGLAESMQEQDASIDRAQESGNG